MKQLLTLPNLLTSLRIVLVPFLMWFFILGGWWLVGALVVFTVAAITDFCDGYVARYMGDCSGFGIILDPIADKVLVVGTFACFVWIGLVPWWFVGVMVGRDLVVTGTRWVWRRKPSDMGPSYLGKCKTVAQIVLIYVLFACLLLPQFLCGRDGMLFTVNMMIYAVAGITIYTGIDYLFRYRMLRHRELER